MRPLVLVGLIGFALLAAAFAARAQTPPPDPPICNTNLREWGRIASGIDTAAMQDLLSRTPRACRELRGQIDSRVAMLRRQSVTPPRPRASVITPPEPGPERGSATVGWRVGQEFDDCGDAAWCPRMVVIGGDSFMMGSPDNEAGRNRDEGPQRRVTIRQFAAGKFEVTFAQWAACAARGGCSVNPHPSDQNWGEGDRPAINVSWIDAQAYVSWLSSETRQTYRLLTEAEWEYAARADTTTPFSTGAGITTSQANFDGTFRRTQPVGSYAPNAFGLYDMHGNVWEWTQDCYAEAYFGLSVDGAAHDPARCSNRVGRGGSWNNNATQLRSALRRALAAGGRSSNFGFRVARSLDSGS